VLGPPGRNLLFGVNDFDETLAARGYRGHDSYVRQYRDMDSSVNPDAMTPAGFASYAQACGRTLARAQVRSGRAR
jgi:hypothetical protein